MTTANLICGIASFCFIPIVVLINFLVARERQTRQNYKKK